MAVETDEELSETQYVFRKSRSKVDAINQYVNMTKKTILGKGASKKYCVVKTLGTNYAFNSEG